MMVPVAPERKNLRDVRPILGKFFIKKSLFSDCAQKHINRLDTIIRIIANL
jgi:hypothetical protein